MKELPEDELVEDVAEGLGLLGEYLLILEGSIKLLSEKMEICGMNILEAFLREEASKFMILFDLIRCPKEKVSNEFLDRQLERFNLHLPKGIYAEAYQFG